MKILSDTTIFNDLLKALDTGMAVYMKVDTLDYISLSEFAYVLNNNIPTISIYFYNFADSYSVIPSEGYSDSDLYIPTNFILSEESAPVVK